MADKPELKLIPDIEVDPFDPEALRIAPEQETAGERLLLSAAVKKPGKGDFFRVNGDPSYTLVTSLIEAEGEWFLVTPRLREVLQADVKNFQIHVCMTRAGKVFLWPVRVVGPDGKSNRWWDDQHRIAKEARTSWLRMVANTDAGGYEVTRATIAIPEPVWPDRTLRDLLELAFGDRRIDSLDHLVVKRLQGRA